jgi:hypothetical protein
MRMKLKTIPELSFDGYNGMRNPDTYTPGPLGTMCVGGALKRTKDSRINKDEPASDWNQVEFNKIR